MQHGLFALAFAVAAVLLKLKRWFAGGVNVHAPDLAGHIYLVTGANTGLGFETARALLALNATVIVAGREAARVAAAVSRLEAARAAGSVGVVDGSLLLDLADLESVRRFATAYLEKYARLDGLIANAGVFALPRDAPRTRQGFEQHFGVNHLAHHLLVRLLLPALEATGAATGDARVVFVSSLGHLWGDLLRAGVLDDLNFERRPVGQEGFEAYTQSKLANVLDAAQLARLSDGRGVRAFSAHPGTVATDMFRHYPRALEAALAPIQWYFFKTPAEGAQTQIYLTVAPLAEIDAHNGGYFADCAPAYTNPQARNASLAAQLWAASDALVGLPPSDAPAAP